MSDRHRVCLLGFSDFERGTLASAFRLAAGRAHDYALVSDLAAARFVVADADRADARAAVRDAGRGADTVFVGHAAPEGARNCVPRPVDALHVLRALDALAAALPAPAPPPAPAPEAPSRHALVVDDSDIAFHYLRSRLERHGVACTGAPTSAKAIELLAQQRFDAVFLDVELAGSELDGLALCQHIKRQHHGGGATPPVVFVSAHDSAADRARGALAGGDAYLGKPLDEAELAAALRRAGLGA